MEEKVQAVVDNANATDLTDVATKKEFLTALAKKFTQLAEEEKEKIIKNSKKGNGIRTEA